ncbi:CRE-SRA-37 protein [Aphelenchoides avenae]|nr:CRE-SRA-37 protein [Aphelenchus avenae]
MWNIPYHGNLKILAFVAAFFYVLHSALMIVVNVPLLIQRSIIFSDPCSYGFTAWQCLLQEIPPYACVIGFTLCHLLIFLERAVATHFLRTYQNRGFAVIAFPVFITAIIYCFWIHYVFSEEDLWALRAHCTPTSPSNAKKIATMFFAMLAIDILTALGDVLLLGLNKRAKRRKIHEYTLQKSYQLHENDIALKLILPISLVHSGVYIGYLCINNVLRRVFANADAAFYVALLEWVHVGVCAYTSAPLIAFYVFSRRFESSKKLLVEDSSCQTELYFKQLQQQFEAAVPSVEKRNRMAAIPCFIPSCVVRFIYYFRY